MCLYPKLIQNRKYISNKKNGGSIPAVSDKRTLLVPIKCGKCMECRKSKARDWQVRLSEEIKTTNNGKFVTLTFSEENLRKLKNKVNKGINKINGYDLDNAIATQGIRYFLERWRKKYGKSVKHWLVTELGQTNTERIHIHGIIFTNEIEEIAKIWKYGIITIGKRRYNEKGENLNDKDLGYVSERTINYIVKYISKTDEKHKEYESKILCSQGIGKNYVNRIDSKKNKYEVDKTDETYKTRKGVKIGLPIYYRNNIYSEEEREKLWIEKLDKKVRWVDGIEIDISKGDEHYYKVLEEARKKNKRLGYGNDEINWSRKKYEWERRNLIKQNKIELANTFIYKPNKEKLTYSCKHYIQPKAETNEIKLGRIEDAF